MRRLVVVAGPPCSGKSTFILELLEGRLATVAETIGITEPRQWVVGYAKRWDVVLPGDPELLILHYDFLRFWKRGETSTVRYQSDPALLRSLELSERSLLVMLWAQPAALIRRVRRRRILLLKRFLRGHFREAIRGYRISRNLVRLYRRPDRLRAHYDRWLAFCMRTGIEQHWIADTTKSVTRLHPGTDWLWPEC